MALNFSLPIVDVDLTLGNYMLSGSAIYKIGEVAGRLEFSDPSTYPGEMIVLNAVFASGNILIDNTNGFAPNGQGSTIPYNVLLTGYVYVFFSSNSNWVGGSLPG